MFDFFRKKKVIPKSDVEKTADIIFRLHKEIESYNTKYPKTTSVHYRQGRAAYLCEFLEKNIRKNNFKDAALRNIVLELYIHSLSINKTSRVSTIGKSINKAIQGILGFYKPPSNNEMEKAVYFFTGVDPKNIKFHANYLSEEEEKISSSWFGLFKTKGGNQNRMRNLCANAHRAINEFKTVFNNKPHAIQQ